MPSLHDITYLIAVSLLNGDLLFPPAALPPSVTPSNGALEEEDTLGTVLDGLWRTPVSWRLFLWAVSSLGSLAFWKWYRRGRRSSDDGADDEESSSARRWWLLGCGFVAFGVCLRAWAKQTLKELFSYEIARPDALVTGDVAGQGPYHLLVHPGYAGILLHLVGLAMLFFDLRSSSSSSSDKKKHRSIQSRVRKRVYVVGSVFCCALACICVRIFEEEAMLRDHFGAAAWDEHLKSRWRLAPGVW